jgi:hypothetical protein
VSFQSSFIATRPCMGSTGGVRSGHVQCTAAFGSRGPRRLRSTLDARVPKRHSNPIADRIRRKRQRLPSSLLIETASARLYALAPAFCAEALPIKPSDNPGVMLQTAKVRLLSATDERRYLSAGTSRNSSKQTKGGRIETSEAVRAPTVHFAHHSWQRGYQDMQTRPAMRAARGSLR